MKESVKKLNLKLMEQEVLLKDVLPYIWVWTVMIAFILLALAYHLWRLGKKYPEIFNSDTTAENSLSKIQKAELQRQYNNKSMLSITIIFVWMIGIVAICCGFDSSAMTKQGWFLLIFAICAILWILSLLQRKPRK